MSSLAPAQTPYKAISGKRTLQRLRREAGYRSAKEFAEALGIPGSTYARYERAGDGADCGIPLRRRGRSRTSLGCSIDLVIGREDIDAPEPEGIQPATTPSVPRAAPSWTATSPTWSSASAPPAPREGGERHGQGREEPQRRLLLPHGTAPGTWSPPSPSSPPRARPCASDEPWQRELARDLEWRYRPPYVVVGDGE